MGIRMTTRYRDYKLIWCVGLWHVSTGTGLLIGRTDTLNAAVHLARADAENWSPVGGNLKTEQSIGDTDGQV